MEDMKKQIERLVDQDEITNEIATKELGSYAYSANTLSELSGKYLEELQAWEDGMISKLKLRLEVLMRANEDPSKTILGTIHTHRRAVC